MSVERVFRNGKFRVVEVGNGRVTTNQKGTPMDGGGHSDGEKAASQAAKINENMLNQKMKKPPK